MAAGFRPRIEPAPGAGPLEFVVCKTDQSGTTEAPNRLRYWLAIMRTHSESEIESARRQLHDAEQRLAHQRALTAEMASWGEWRGARIARQFLANLRATVALARSRVEVLEHEETAVAVASLHEGSTIAGAGRRE